MSLTVIFGDPGVGKSALLTSFIRNIYRDHSFEIMQNCCARIEEINAKYKTNLIPPDRVPIFTDYKVKFLVGYEEEYETYFTNGFYAGLPHGEELDTIYLPPFSVVALTEIQRYYDSRKKNLPDWVSRTYEMHRHYGLDFYFDLQRFMLLDKNIRDNCSRIIEVDKMRHKINEFGGIVSTEWDCREWKDSADCERYLSTGVENFKKVIYGYNGNIFDCYDSYNYKDKFLPPVGKNFTYLSHVDNVNDVSEKLLHFYDFSEPLKYR